MSYKGNWDTFLTDKCLFREGKRSGVSCRLVRGQGLSRVALGAGGVHPARVGGGPGFDFSPRTPCQPLTIETNPGKSALQGREPAGNKIAHRRFFTFLTPSRHVTPGRLDALALRIP